MPTVKELLDSNEPRKIKAGLNYLSEKGKLGDLKSAMAFIRQGNKEISSCAVKASGNIVKRNLISYFGSLDENTKNKLAGLLKKLDPGIIKNISADLYSENEEYRFRALQVLGLLGQDAAIKKTISDMLLDKNEKMRATSISLMRTMVNSNDLEIILKVLKDDDPRVRANGIETLENLGNVNTAGILMKFKRDPNNRVRGNVLKALWNLGQRDIIQDLKIMLEDRKNPLMPVSAAWVIGETAEQGDKGLIHLLSDYTLEEDALLIENIAKAFLKIGGKGSVCYLEHLIPPEITSDACIFMKKMNLTIRAIPPSAAKILKAEGWTQ
ncbi:MAG: HEAT repeat domain-containing protein [Fibrobacterota bacterium]